MNNDDLRKPIWSRDFTVQSNNGSVQFRVIVRENTSGWHTPDLIEMIDHVIDDVITHSGRRFIYDSLEMRVAEICFATYRGEWKVGRVRKVIGPKFRSTSVVRLKPLDRLGLSDLDYLTALGKADCGGPIIGYAPDEVKWDIQELLQRYLFGLHRDVGNTYVGPLRFTSSSKKRDAEGRAVESRNRIDREVVWAGLNYVTRMLRVRVREQRRAVAHYKHARRPEETEARHIAALAALREATAQVEEAQRLLTLIANEEDTTNE